MKKSVLIIAAVLLLTSGLMGQNTGKGFNFQAVARHSDGSIQSEQTVQLSISIYPTEEKTALLYQEHHTVNTDKFGVFSLTIGKGVYAGGSASDFKDIDFSLADAYLNVVLKEGGDDIEIAHDPLLSVPYSESSAQADNGMPIGAIITYAGAVNDNTDNVTVYGCKGTWRLCNGAEYDPLEFTSLHLVLNDAWGTNRLPDLRGVFLRGTNYTASDAYSDPDITDRDRRGADDNVGNQVGSFQDDEFESHTHTNKTTFIVDGAAGRFSGGSWGAYSANPAINNTGGNETRSKNAYVNFIIRVK